MNLSLSLLSVLVLESWMSQVSIEPANAAATAHQQQAAGQRSIDGGGPNMTNVSSTVEHGVLVVRHGPTPAASAASTSTHSAPDSSAGAMRAAPGVRAPKLYRVQVDEPWRYRRPPKRSQEELKPLWTFRKKTDWAYHKTPERSQEEVRHLWTYHPTVRKGWQRQRGGLDGP